MARVTRPGGVGRGLHLGFLGRDEAAAAPSGSRRGRSSPEPPRARRAPSTRLELDALWRGAGLGRRRGRRARRLQPVRGLRRALGHVPARRRPRRPAPASRAARTAVGDPRRVLSRASASRPAPSSSTLAPGPFAAASPARAGRAPRPGPARARAPARRRCRSARPAPRARARRTRRSRGAFAGSASSSVTSSSGSCQPGSVS